MRSFRDNRDDVASVACPKVAQICSAGRGRRAATEMQTTTFGVGPFIRPRPSAERSYKEATTMYSVFESFEDNAA